MIIRKSLDPRGNRHWKTTTAPGVEPITVDEVKDLARIDGTEEDIFLQGAIKAIREAMEKYLGRALIEQTIKMTMDHWPNNPVKLPMPPLISVTQIVTLDEDDAETVYSSSSYYTNTIATPGEIIIKFGDTPPINTDRYHSGFRVDYKAGYGTAGADVPQPIREAMKIWCTVYYETRTLTEKPPSQVISILENMYRVPRI